MMAAAASTKNETVDLSLAYSSAGVAAQFKDDFDLSLAYSLAGVTTQFKDDFDPLTYCLIIFRLVRRVCFLTGRLVYRL